MDNIMVTDLLRGIMDDRGVPRNVKESVQESLGILKRPATDNEKFSEILTVLDEAVNDPNISMAARTLIWNAVSTIEDMGNL